MYRNEEGFSLLELVVAVGVAGVIAIVALPVFAGLQDKATSTSAEYAASASAAEALVNSTIGANASNSSISSGSGTSSSSSASSQIVYPIEDTKLYYRADFRIDYVTGLTAAEAAEVAFVNVTYPTTGYSITWQPKNRYSSDQRYSYSMNKTVTVELYSTFMYGHSYFSPDGIIYDNKGNSGWESVYQAQGNYGLNGYTYPIASSSYNSTTKTLSITLEYMNY